MRCFGYITRLLIVCTVILLACSMQARAADPQPASQTASYRVYFIGNSLTDNIQYDALERIAAHQKVLITWGRHMIPGAPLSWIWEHPQDGFMKKPFGYYPQALPNHQWDVISLQPFDRRLAGAGNDVQMIGRFVNLARKASPDARYVIYAHWPRMYVNGKALKYDRDAFDPDAPIEQNIDLTRIDDFAEIWTQPYTGGWDGTNETRDYYQKLLAAVSKQHPDQSFVLAPVGEVMYRVHQQLKTGTVEGYSTVWQLYKDAIHLNPTGCYLAGCTYFALITGRSAQGLPHEPYGDVEKKLLPLIQTTVDQVVLQK